MYISCQGRWKKEQHWDKSFKTWVESWVLDVPLAITVGDLPMDTVSCHLLEPTCLTQHLCKELVQYSSVSTTTFHWQRHERKKLLTRKWMLKTFGFLWEKDLPRHENNWVLLILKLICWYQRLFAFPYLGMQCAGGKNGKKSGDHLQKASVFLYYLVGVNFTNNCRAKMNKPSLMLSTS